jgi:hypothetical protein
MKKAIATFLIAFIVALPARAGEAFSVEIIRSAALPKGTLFDQTVLWMAESFRSSKEVIELKDKELGTIIGNGAFDMNIGASFLPVNTPVTFKLRIDIKDNKYRMTFTNVNMVFDGRPKPIEDTNRTSNEPKVRERFEQIANSLDSYLATPRKDF